MANVLILEVVLLQVWMQESKTLISDLTILAVLPLPMADKLGWEILFKIIIRLG